MMKSKAPKAKVKMRPVGDHLNYRFLNRAMGSFQTMGFVFLIRSAKVKVNIFRLAESMDLSRVKLVVRSYQCGLLCEKCCGVGGSIGLSFFGM